jgi:hypothetical protein
MKNPTKFNKAYRLRGLILQRLSRLFVNGYITSTQYHQRVNNANKYVLKRGV